MLKPKVDAIGLEIGTSALKAVELKAGNPPSLASLALRPMPPGLLQGDQVVDAAGLADEIRALLDDAGISRRAVVTAVGNRQAITRNITLPRMTLQELGDAIHWEAERYIPFPIDEVELDWYALDNPADLADGEEMEVVIAAARRDLLTSQVDYLRQSGLEPVVMDIKPFSLLRSLKGSLLGEHLNRTTLTGERFTEADEVGVVIEIGASSSTITLVRGNRVLMNRNIGVSGDDVTAAIQRMFGLDFDTAEEIKIDYAMASIPTEEEEELLALETKHEQYTPGRVHGAVRPVLADLTNEIRRSLEFFRVQTGDADIQRVLLTGGGSKLRGLAGAISDSLGFRVELGDPWLTVTVDENRFDRQYLESFGPEFAVPMGLALRGVSGDD
ncbi:MAG TPA: type IV pilus assembly protein PilM [Deinococcales bacterium]|nr:type IV pilus assembly protein PilM [Deinococcales bacterium]